MVTANRESLWRQFFFSLSLPASTTGPLPTTTLTTDGVRDITTVYHWAWLTVDRVPQYSRDTVPDGGPIRRARYHSNWTRVRAPLDWAIDRWSRLICALSDVSLCADVTFSTLLCPMSSSTDTYTYACAEGTILQTFFVINKYLVFALWFCLLVCTFLFWKFNLFR